MRRQTITMIVTVVFLTTAGIILVPSTRAEGKCNLHTIKGDYGYLNTGSFFGTALASVGSITFDGAGNVSGKDTNSFGGTVTPNTPFTGSYTVNADCTGTLTVSFGFFSIMNNMVIVDNGKEINVIETNPGAVATGVFKRQ